VDAPPVLETMGNVRHLISLVDGVIYVVKSGSTSIKDVKEATNYLKEYKTKIIGTILNQVKIGEGYYKYYGYYK
jgi:Mrp family chromosome partitioning ATPase